MKKRKLRPAVKFILTFFVILMAAYVSGKFLPNFEAIDFFEYWQITDSLKPAIVLDDEVAHGSAEYNNNEVYLSVDFVKNNIDQYIFWDENESKLTITTEKKVIRMQTNDLEYYVNNEPMQLDMPVYSIDTAAYMPAKILNELYGIDINYYSSSNIVVIDTNSTEKYIAEVSEKKADVRYEPDKKSAIAAKLNAGEEVVIFSTDAANNYIKIRTPDGRIGYIKRSSLTQPELITTPQPAEQAKDPWKPENGKINMVFDQVTNVAANSTAQRRIYHDGLDILSPTWFSFLNTDGDVKNIADTSYVEWAHSNNYQVWGLITDNFNSEICHSIISSTQIREHVIKQLLAFVSLYDLDGINIDFEAVPKDDGDYYIQFLRELTPLMREQGVVVSVDTYLPKSWSRQYRRGEASEIVDYMIVMGYDEHYAGSSQSGSVASYAWSVEAIENMLNEGVSKDKLILGIPFYTRIWEEEMTSDGISLSSTAYAMDTAKQFMLDKGAEFVWLDDIGQYYAEVTKNGITYKVWLEDERSVENRVKLIVEYDIAGCAAWKRGHESAGIWEILKNNLKNID